MEKNIYKWIKARKIRIPVYEGQSINYALKHNLKFYNKSSKKVNIETNHLTQCLIDCKTKAKVKTTVKQIKITKKLQNQMYKKGWLFNWSKDSGKEKYALAIENSSNIEGLISLDIDDGYVFVNLVESSPTNRGKVKRYEGVGAHLFAIACKRSFEEGFNGYVCFYAKTNLINYYKDTLKAEKIGSQRMIITTKNAKILVDTYYKGGDIYVR